MTICSTRLLDRVADRNIDWHSKPSLGFDKQNIFVEPLDWLHYPKKMQNDQDDCDNDQNMDPAAGFREARIDSPTEEPEQPQDKQYYNDGP
jgi:hypothetical protein